MFDDKKKEEDLELLETISKKVFNMHSGKSYIKDFGEIIPKYKLSEKNNKFYPFKDCYSEKSKNVFTKTTIQNIIKISAIFHLEKERTGKIKKIIDIIINFYGLSVLYNPIFSKLQDINYEKFNDCIEKAGNIEYDYFKQCYECKQKQCPANWLSNVFELIKNNNIDKNILPEPEKKYSQLIDKMYNKIKSYEENFKENYSLISLNNNIFIECNKMLLNVKDVKDEKLAYIKWYVAKLYVYPQLRTLLERYGYYCNEVTIYDLLDSALTILTFCSLNKEVDMTLFKNIYVDYIKSALIILHKCPIFFTDFYKLKILELRANDLQKLEEKYSDNCDKLEIFISLLQYSSITKNSKIKLEDISEKIENIISKKYGLKNNRIILLYIEYYIFKYYCKKDNDNLINAKKIIDKIICDKNLFKNYESLFSVFEKIYIAFNTKEHTIWYNPISGLEKILTYDDNYNVIKPSEYKRIIFSDIINYFDY